MKLKTIGISLLLIPLTLLGDQPQILEKIEIKESTTKGYGLYNIFIEYQRFEAEFSAKTFHTSGFSLTKKLNSKSNLPLREFVVNGDNKKIEITTSNGIYTFDKKYRDHYITSNQPPHTEDLYFIFRFTPPVSSDGSIQTPGLLHMLSEFNGFLKGRCKSIDKQMHAPPFTYQLKHRAPRTTADLFIITSSSLEYLIELNRNGVGRIEGKALLIPAKTMEQLPSDWHIDSQRINHIFPWTEKAPPPKISDEGIWMWVGVVRWAWQSPDGWCLPQFYRP